MSEVGARKIIKFVYLAANPELNESVDSALPLPLPLPNQVL